MQLELVHQISHNPPSQKVGGWGEWNRLGIMKEAEIVYLTGTDGIDRIYPPKAYRSKILDVPWQFM